ncbi:MAG: CpaE family protein [Gemmataceae bacterium]
MRVVVAANETRVRNQLRQLVLNFAHECSSEDAVGFDELPFRLIQEPPDVLLFAAGTEPKIALRVLKELDQEACRSILVVGPSNDQSLRSEVMNHRVRAFLNQTNLREEFETVSNQLADELFIPPRKLGKAIAVTAVNAGHGVTTVATNLAFTLAELSCVPVGDSSGDVSSALAGGKKTGTDSSFPFGEPSRDLASALLGGGKNKTTQLAKTVALAEMGNGIPELSLTLDLQPRHTIDQLMQQWDRMDVGMLQRAAEFHPSGVHVLAYAQQTLTPSEFDPKGVRQAAMLSRAAFDFVVFDLGHSVSAATLAALKVADVVVVVTRGDVPALRLCREYLRTLKRNGVAGEKMLRVANRHGQPRQLSSKQMEEALGLSFHAWIPEDPGSINAAVNQGFPLIEKARNRPIMKQFRGLAELIIGKS